MRVDEIGAPHPEEKPARRPALQTLDRGIALLKIVADHAGPVSLAALSAEMGLHRSIVYRLLCTLQDHRMVTHTDGGYDLGTGAVSLGRRVMSPVQDIVKPEVAKLASRTGLTAFFAVRDGEEAVTLVSVEVESSRTRAVYFPGVRHPLGLGAPGIAMLSAEPARPGERSEVAEARHRGYAMTRGEVVRNLATIAAPVTSSPGVAFGALAIAFVRERPGPDEILAVRQAASVITHKIGRALANGLLLAQAG
jgi:DNA-binding IclR family transcriptional regulator